VNFVDAALRVLPEKPFMVLALARPEVDRRFPGVWKERSPQRINLAPLSPRVSQRMIEHVVGKIPEESSRWIVDRAQGNPFYLEELLRGTRRGQGGRRQQPARHGAGHGAGAFRHLWPGRQAGVARGQHLWPDLQARRGQGTGRRRPAQGCGPLAGDLAQREILFSRPTADLREYAFRHALLRQAAYEMLPPSEKRLGHLLAGQYLEQAGERQGIVLADHFERAGENPRAIHWLGVAAQQALDADDLVETLGRVERGVKLGAAGRNCARCG